MAWEPMRIRTASANDALAIGRVHVETWRSAYRDIVPSAYLDNLLPEERAVLWRTVLLDPSGARFVLVAADEGGELIGFAAGGPERSAELEDRGELYALYVLPSHQRRGLGLALVQASPPAWRAAGCSLCCSGFSRQTSRRAASMGNSVARWSVTGQSTLVV
jgi:GNAT superfamily N-acetyltransferase